MLSIHCNDHIFFFALGLCFPFSFLITILPLKIEVAFHLFSYLLLWGVATRHHWCKKKKSL